MYLSHFQLTSKPFVERAPAEFYYPAEGHQAALHKLRYALEDAGGAHAGGGHWPGTVANRTGGVNARWLNARRREDRKTG